MLPKVFTQLTSAKLGEILVRRGLVEINLKESWQNNLLVS